MIIKFKIFEATESFSRFWILPTDKRFIPSLNQINCPKKAQKELREDRKNILKHNSNIKFIIIFFTAMEDMNPWRMADMGHIGLFNDSEYQFGGYINIEDYELDAEKYNL